MCAGDRGDTYPSWQPSAESGAYVPLVVLIRRSHGAGDGLASGPEVLAGTEKHAHLPYPYGDHMIEGPDQL